MNLSELYAAIVSRESVPYESVRPRNRIAIETPSGELDVMKVESVGPGRGNPDEEMRYVAVAKICPGQLSVRLGSDGGVHQNELREVTHTADAYLTGPSIWVDDELGALQLRLGTAYWAELDGDTPIKRITKPEMRSILEAAGV